MNIGDKVHYIPYEGAPLSDYKNGIIKSFHHFHNAAYIVYSCGGDWGNYDDYTGQYTSLSSVKSGWVDIPNSANPYTNIDY